MNRQELKKAFESDLIDEETYKTELFKLEQSPKKVSKASRIYDPVKMPEFQALMKITKKPIHRISFMLAFGSGLRISEIVGGKREDGSMIPALTADNVDLKMRKIMIRGAKGRKDRMVTPPKWLREKHLKLLPIVAGSRALERVFLRNSLKAVIEGKPINKVIDTYPRVMKGVEQQVPIYRLKFHSLRRGCGAYLADQGVPIHTVQAFLGHSSLATTTRYTKSNVEDNIDKIMEAWD